MPLRPPTTGFQGSVANRPTTGFQVSVGCPAQTAYPQVAPRPGYPKPGSQWLKTKDWGTRITTKDNSRRRRRKLRLLVMMRPSSSRSSPSGAVPGRESMEELDRLAAQEEAELRAAGGVS